MRKVLSFGEWGSINESSSFEFDPSGNYDEMGADKTFGLPKGQPHSGKVYLGGEGGDWGGSMQRALAFAKFVMEFTGKPDIISSQKRERVVPGSTENSDHSVNSSTSYAIDIACTGEEGDTILAGIMKWLDDSKSSTSNDNFTSYKGGEWLSFTKEGYRYQIGWKVTGHYDHIHIGVSKVGPGSQDTGTSTSRTELESTTPPKVKEAIRKAQSGETDPSKYPFEVPDASEDYEGYLEAQRKIKEWEKMQRYQKYLDFLKEK